MGKPTENILKRFLWHYLCCIDNNELSHSVYPITGRPTITIHKAYQLNVSYGEQSGMKEEQHTDVVTCSVFAMHVACFTLDRQTEFLAKKWKKKKVHCKNLC